MEKQDLQNFLLLPLLFLGRLFLTQVSSLTVTHSSTSFTVVLHIKGSGNCKGKYTRELQFNQCSSHTPEQTWFRQSCFLWRGLQHVMPVWKQGFFAITTVIPCFLFLKCFPCWRKARTYKLALYNTLPDFTEDKTSFPGILTGHTIEDNKKMTKTSTKLLQYISAIRSQQTAWQKAPVCHSKAPCERFTQHHNISAGLHTDPTISWQQYSCTGMFSHFSCNRGTQLLLSSPHQVSEVTGNTSPTTHM